MSTIEIPYEHCQVTNKTKTQKNDPILKVFILLKVFYIFKIKSEIFIDCLLLSRNYYGVFTAFPFIIRAAQENGFYYLFYRWRNRLMVSDHARSHSWKGAKPGLEARSVWVYSTYSFTSPIAILRIVEWKFWLFWVFMVLRDPNKVNPGWWQPLVLFFLFLLLGGTDSRVPGSVACHYPLQWHSAPTLAGKTILHDNGLQSVHCEILALNFSREEVMGSHLSR